MAVAETVPPDGSRARVLAAGFLLACVVAYLVVRARTVHFGVDLMVYRATGHAVLHGQDIYGHLATRFGLLSTYPPFAALLFVPLAAVPFALLQNLALAANLGLLGLVAYLSCRLIGIDRGRCVAAAMVLAGVATWSEPVNTTLRLGQIDLVVLALVLLDLARPGGSPGRGVGIGLAAAVKVTPAAFIVYFLLTRRWREAAVAAATTVVASAVGFVVLPGSSELYWRHLLFDTARVGQLGDGHNQSVRGLLARLAPHSPGLLAAAAAALVGIAGLVVARYAYLRLGEAWGATSCAVAALLATPVAWTHHWVWCIPIVALLWRSARPWTLLAVVFWTFGPAWLPRIAGPPQRYPGWATALSGWYVYLGLAFLVLAAVRARRSPGSGAAPVARAGGRPAPVAG